MATVGGLELAEREGARRAGGGGGLELAQAGDPFEDAIMNLRIGAQGYEPDAVSMFAVRANNAYPTWKEISQRIESELDRQNAAGEASLSELQHPPINRGLPWLQAAAGLMKPTRTGSIGESLGYGVEGLAKGEADVNKSELDFAKAAADSRYKFAHDRLAGVEGLYGIGMKSQQLEAMLGMLRQRMGTQMLTPAIKEWAMVNNVPIQDIIEGRVPDDKRASLMQFINLARGTSQIKNAQAILDPRNPEFSNTVKLLSNQTLVSKMMQAAEQDVPLSAYQGQPIEVRNQKVLERFWELLRQNSVGTSAGQPLPIAGEAGNLHPPVAAPSAPPARPALPAPPAPAAAAPSAAPGPAGPEGAPSSPFDEFIRPTPLQGNQPGVIQNEQQQAQQKAIVELAEKRASEYVEKEVYPGLKSADDMRTSAIIARQLLEKDPQLTGSMKPLMSEFANFMTTLGLAPERAQQFATNQSLFRSQAMLQVLAKQLEQKGVQTESDALRIMQAGIDPSKPAAANRFMIRFMEATANRLQERAAFFDRWQHDPRTGGSLAGAVEAWNAYSRKYPMAVVRDGRVYFRDVKF